MTAGCDLVGFHINDYCVNFVDCCQRLLGCRIEQTKNIVCHQSRRVHVRALPIGIPYQRYRHTNPFTPNVIFSCATYRFESMSKVAKRVFPNDVRVILGVDRLDYTKGLVARLRALDRFFDEFPQWIGKCTFLQVYLFKSAYYGLKTS